MQQLLIRYKKQCIAAGIFAIAALLYFLLPAKAEQPLFISASLPADEQSEKIQEESAIIAEPELVYVDIKGAVRYPGVYSVSANYRIVDAIQVAGGYLENADPTQINLAQKVQDEMIIYVPIIGESEWPLSSEIVTNNASSSSGKININNAKLEDLTQLTGIGPSKAQAIIEYREKNGPFKSIDDLKNVTGIGDKTYEKLKDEIEI